MAGRPKIFNEEQVIDKATEVFWDKCYDAASADDLLQAMGIGKGSFYLSFKGGKQELYEKSLKQFGEKFYTLFQEKLSESADKIAFLKRFFLSMADVPSMDKRRGCYLGNALVQLSNKDEKAKETAAKLLTNLQKVFAQTIHEAQENGALNTTENPEILGWYLSNLWNGINVTRRMEKSPEVLRNLIELNLKILE